ncbi:hypothetical protein TNCV_1808311 [Trichonephila clavipes]|nr:hypothetical protein TNCV_1808311 [Trichonephila clavipes]
MVEFHPNFSALHPHIDNMSAKVLLKRSVSVHFCLGMIRRCETINVTQVDERGNKSDRKTAPRSVIITRGAPCLRTISSSKNFAISATSAVGKAFVIAYR